MRLKADKCIKDALLTVTQKVYHYQAPPDEDAPYIVWMEYGQADSIWANNRMVAQSMQGVIEYYTPDENDPAVEAIQHALTAAGIAFALDEIEFDKETGLICHVWTFESVWEAG